MRSFSRILLECIFELPEQILQRTNGEFHRERVHLRVVVVRRVDAVTDILEISNFIDFYLYSKMIYKSPIDILSEKLQNDAFIKISETVRYI